MFAAFHSLWSMPCKLNKNFSNFHYDQNLEVKLQRFFKLNLSVWTKFHFVSFESWNNSFPLHEYCSYLTNTKPPWELNPALKHSFYMYNWLSSFSLRKWKDTVRQVPTLEMVRRKRKYLNNCWTKTLGFDGLNVDGVSTCSRTSFGRMTLSRVTFETVAFGRKTFSRISNSQAFSRLLFSRIIYNRLVFSKITFKDA